MTRRRSYQSHLTLRRLLSNSLALAGLLLPACGVLTPEEQLLQRFFEASRLYDTAALEKVSTVLFNPVTDGIVQDFSVSAVNPAEQRPEGPPRRTVGLVALVRGRNGTSSERTLTATLERRGERWIIVDVK